MPSVKFEKMPDHVWSSGRQSFRVVRPVRAAPSIEKFDPNDMPPSFQMEFATLEVTQFCLATQDFLIAFDPVTQTVYVGEPKLERGNHPGGYIFRSAERAALMGKDTEYTRAALIAECHASEARTSARLEQFAREKHARATADAIERLKSSKPGVRRRAKRLLAKLGAVR